VLRGLEWPRVAQALSGASWRWIAAAAALVVLDRVVMAWRWLALLSAVERHRLPFASAMRVFFISGFAGTFLPGGVGGDAVRAVHLARLGVTPANSVASVVVDRVIGTLSVFFMGAAGVWLVGSRVDGRLLPLALAASGLATVVTYGLLFDGRIYRWLLRRSGARRFPTVDRLAHKFLAATSQYRHHRPLLAAVLGASLGVQILRTLQVWALGLAIGLTVPGYWYFGFVPVLVLVMLLPLGFSGLGAGTAAFVELFGVVGVGRDAAFVLSLLYSALALVGLLPGGLMLLTPGPAASPTRPDDA
jgi:uncharacterized protein (TIRG00374 family)